MAAGADVITYKPPSGLPKQSKRNSRQSNEKYKDDCKQTEDFPLQKNSSNVPSNTAKIVKKQSGLTQSSHYKSSTERKSKSSSPHFEGETSSMERLNNNIHGTEDKRTDRSDVPFSGGVGRREPSLSSNNNKNKRLGKPSRSTKILLKDVRSGRTFLPTSTSDETKPSAHKISINSRDSNTLTVSQRTSEVSTDYTSSSYVQKSFQTQSDIGTTRDKKSDARIRHSSSKHFKRSSTSTTTSPHDYESSSYTETTSRTETESSESSDVTTSSSHQEASQTESSTVKILIKRSDARTQPRTSKYFKRSSTSTTTYTSSQDHDTTSDTETTSETETESSESSETSSDTTSSSYEQTSTTQRGSFETESDIRTKNGRKFGTQNRRPHIKQFKRSTTSSTMPSQSLKQFDSSTTYTGSMRHQESFQTEGDTEMIRAKKFVKQIRNPYSMRFKRLITSSTATSQSSNRSERSSDTESTSQTGTESTETSSSATSSYSYSRRIQSEKYQTMDRVKRVEQVRPTKSMVKEAKHVYDNRFDEQMAPSTQQNITNNSSTSQTSICEGTDTLDMITTINSVECTDKSPKLNEKKQAGKAKTEMKKSTSSTRDVPLDHHFHTAQQALTKVKSKGRRKHSITISGSTSVLTEVSSCTDISDDYSPTTDPCLANRHFRKDNASRDGVHCGHTNRRQSLKPVSGISEIPSSPMSQTFSKAQPLEPGVAQKPIHEVKSEEMTDSWELTPAGKMPSRLVRSSSPQTGTPLRLNSNETYKVALASIQPQESQFAQVAADGCTASQSIHVFVSELDSTFSFKLPVSNAPKEEDEQMAAGDSRTSKSMPRQTRVSTGNVPTSQMSKVTVTGVDERGAVPISSKISKKEDEVHTIDTVEMASTATPKPIGQAPKSVLTQETQTSDRTMSMFSKSSVKAGDVRYLDKVEIASTISPETQDKASQSVLTQETQTSDRSMSVYSKSSVKAGGVRYVDKVEIASTISPETQEKASQSVFTQETQTCKDLSIPNVMERKDAVGFGTSPRKLDLLLDNLGELLVSVKHLKGLNAKTKKNNHFNSLSSSSLYSSSLDEEYTPSVKREHRNSKRRQRRSRLQRQNQYDFVTDLDRDISFGSPFPSQNIPVNLLDSLAKGFISTLGAKLRGQIDTYHPMTTGYNLNAYQNCWRCHGPLPLNSNLAPYGINQYNMGAFNPRLYGQEFHNSCYQMPRHPFDRGAQNAFSQMYGPFNNDINWNMNNMNSVGLADPLTNHASESMQDSGFPQDCGNPSFPTVSQFGNENDMMDLFTLLTSSNF